MNTFEDAAYCADELRRWADCLDNPGLARPASPNPAAAPKLLAALRLTLAEMEAMHAHHHPNCEGGCPYWEAHRAACAAIAKAKP